MKTIPLALLLLSLFTVGKLPAQSASWTSNDGRSIEARFLGVGPGSVLIEMDGTTFIVPFSRLSSESVAQAKALGGLQETNVGTQPHGIPPLPVPGKTGTALAKKSPVVAPATRISATMPKPSYARMASVTTHRESANPPMSYRASGIDLQGRVAVATDDLPATVQRAIEAGNRLQTKPYKWGGGRSPLEDTGYDCSGSVSYVLIKAGLLDEARTSRTFATYGVAGPGKWLTIYAGPGHVFMTVCGLRLDTGGRGGMGESGPRWSPNPRYGSGWTVRHPPGF